MPRSRRRASRSVAPLLALVAAATLAACGGGSDATGRAGAAGAEGTGAAVTPASAVLFVDADLDTGSEAWQRVTALGERFPGWPAFLARLDAKLAGHGGGTSFAEDVQPWLGEEASFAVTGVRVGGSADAPRPEIDYVAYVASRDDVKLRAFLGEIDGLAPGGRDGDYELWTGRTGGDDIALAVGDGALLAASTEQGVRDAVALREGTGDALGESELFRDTLGKLSGENVLVGYVDGAQARQLARLSSGLAGPAGAGAALSGLAGLNDAALKGYRSFGFALAAEDDGARVRSVSMLEDGAAPVGVTENFEPALTARVPSGALVYAGFRDLGPTLAAVLDVVGAADPDVGAQLGQLEAITGVSFREDLVPLLSGEHALYVGAGAPVSAALLLRPDDAASGAGALRKLTGAAARLQPGLVFSPLPTGEGQSARIGGQTVLWRRAGDVVAVGNDPTAGEDQGDGLAGSAKYRELAEKAGLPDELGGVLYVDVPGIGAVADGLGDGDRTSPDVERIGGLLGWSVRDGDAVRGELFLEVR